MGARCFVALVLVLLQGVSFALGQTMQPVAVVLSASYLATAALGARYVHFEPPMRGFGAAWMLSTGVDLAVFAALQVTQGGNINYTPLFALPVLMSAVLGTVMVSMGTTATVTLLLLADAAWHWVQQPGDSPARFVQAALTGTGLFVVALLAHELARRLAREEAVSQHNRSSAQMQAQVNDTGDRDAERRRAGDRRRGHWCMRPTRRPMRSWARAWASCGCPFRCMPSRHWHALAALARQTYARRESQSEEIPVAQARGAAREVRVRTRLTPSSDQRMGSLCVMFLQDLRELEARIRTEKLAAMGRPCRPRSRTRSATRWPPSRRPARCSTRT